MSAEDTDTQTTLSDIMTRINLLLAVSINWAGVVFERVNRILGCRCKVDIRKHAFVKATRIYESKLTNHIFEPLKSRMSLVNPVRNF